MNNSNDVKSYAKEASIRAQMKIYQVLLWIYRHGFATENVIQKLLGIERRPCSSLVRRGVLTRVKPREGFRAVYVLGAAYLDRAQEVHEAEVNMAMPYTQHRTAIPWIELAIHNELVQLVAIAEIERNGGGYRSEAELRYCAIPGQAIPDFSICADGEEVVWHEVERSPKYQERLFLQLAERDAARKAGQFNKIVWWCTSQGVMNNLDKALRRERIPHVMRRGDYKLVLDLSREGWNPSDLSRVCEFRLGGEDF